MDNRANDQSGKGNLLTGRFEIPAWLLILIAIAAILAAALRINIPPFLWILILILLIVIGWLGSQTNRPSGRSVEISDEDAREYKLRFSNLPENVNPRTLRIPDRESLKGFPKDKEVGEVLSIAADIAFYDNNDRLVSRFAEPVTLTFNYTDEDKRRLAEREQMLGQKAIMIPVYLYSPVFKTQQQGAGAMEEMGDNQIWLPFQKFSRDEGKQTLTVEFMFWGDGQIGPGTNP